ncbi:MAG: hypothetical protein M3Y33_17050 [Actinomycetota bacterium]|nr:hypothetical protein [Actinomycetota bacterium]
MADDIQVDVSDLQQFATAIRNALSSNINMSSADQGGFIPAHLLWQGPQFPDVGHAKVGSAFSDGQKLYDKYNDSRDSIIGDKSGAPGSFADFLKQLSILAGAAEQIAAAYQNASNADQVDAGLVDTALNSVVTTTTATPQTPTGPGLTPA